MSASLQDRLSHWPLRLKGIGLDGNTIIDVLSRHPAGLTVPDIRALSRSHPLGMITKHGLTFLSAKNPLRYALTEKGHAYHQLLQDHHFLP